MPARLAWDPDLAKVGRRIDGIHNEFERGVCEALYRSPEQRRRRIAIAFALGLKHGLRGLLFSWPLYLLGFAALALPHAGGRWLALFLLPGLWVSGLILVRGVREDYRRFLHRVVLKPRVLKHLLFPGSS